MWSAYPHVVRVSRLDPDIVAKAQAGSEDALDRVLEDLATALAPTAVALAGREEAPRLLGDALSRVYERLRQLREPAAILPWARRTLVRLYADERRRSLRLERVHVELRYRASAASSTDTFELRDAVSRLRPAERAVLVLHYWLGLTLDECAVELGIPRGTVRSRLASALAALRVTLRSDR